LLESSSIRHTRHSLHVHKRRSGGLKESSCGRGSSIGSPLLLPNIISRVWSRANMEKGENNLQWLMGCSLLSQCNGWNDIRSIFPPRPVQMCVHTKQLYISADISCIKVYGYTQQGRRAVL
jgi:hypothetical protein